MLRHSVGVYSKIVTFSMMLGCTFLGSQTPKPPHDSRSVNRLAALGKLWGTVRYLHPQLSYRPLDWDAALLAAIPKVKAATSTQEYQKAISSLLQVLEDPATTVHQESLLETSTKGPWLTSKVGEGGILTVHFTKALTRESSLDRALRSKYKEELEGNFALANGIVIDLRGVSIDPAVVETIDLLNSALVGGQPAIPAERTLVHFGYPPQVGTTSGGYTEAFIVNSPRAFGQSAKLGTKRVAILVDERSPVPSFALALQGLGRGWIIAEHGISDAGTVSTQTMSLGEGLLARIRIGELISPAGVGGIQADEIIRANWNQTPDRMEMAAGIWLSGKGPAQLPRNTDVLPATPRVRIDKTYEADPYPSQGLRLLGLFRFWNVIHHFFPYKRLMDRDWDSALTEFIPKFEEARDARAYALVMAEIATLTQDSHVSIRNNISFDRFLGIAQPPLRVQMINRLPVVTQVFSEDKDQSNGLMVGDIILKVDGLPASERMSQLKPYLPSSTPQWLDHLLTVYLLRGDDLTSVEVQASGKNGVIKTVRLTRTKESTPAIHYRGARSGEVVRILPGNIGYVDLDRLRIFEVDAMWVRLNGTKGIVFDMRGYPNGTIWTFGPRLNVNKAKYIARFNQPLVPGGESSRDLLAREFYSKISTTEQPLYRGRTVMLMDERSVSQSEYTGQYLKEANGTTFIGSPTCGATGDVTNMTMPGGSLIRFTGQSVVYVDGRQIQRVGLIPDILVNPTLDGVRAGQDEVLDRAVTFLNTGN